MSKKDERLAQPRQSIPEVSPVEAHALQANGAVLVDVREPDEVAGGSPPGALRLVRGFLELRIEQSVADLDAKLLVMCGGGVRSLFAAAWFASCPPTSASLASRPTRTRRVWSHSSRQHSATRSTRHPSDHEPGESDLGDGPGERRRGVPGAVDPVDLGSRR